MVRSVVLFRKLATLAFLSAGLFSCNVNSEGESPSNRAEAFRKNRSQEDKWEAHSSPYYQYSLSYQESFSSRNYQGACRIDADTSFCDLVRTDELGEVSGRLQTRGLTAEEFFTKIDSLIDGTPPPGIFPMADPVLDTIFVRRDTLLFAITFPDTAQESGASWPSGVLAVYDSVHGFPRILRRLPFGPNYELSNFVKLSEE